MKKDNDEDGPGRSSCQQEISVTPSTDIDQERRELARLVGELLAGHWLQDRSGKERQISGESDPS